jgi:hypothetical protein
MPVDYIGIIYAGLVATGGIIGKFVNFFVI